jgi:uncharacterized protein with ParB-like and HNH nuclease domain
MTIAIMDTKNQTFQEIMGNGHKYSVPAYQRDYSWDKEQWEDLWADIQAVFDSDQQHYMGYVVLQSGPDKEYKIIDGQQRLTTLSLIILAALRRIQELIDEGNDVEGNQTRQEVIRSKYIGAIDSVSLQTENKLTLNRNNNTSFRQISSDLKGLLKRKLKRTNRLMSDAFDFFYKNFNKKTSKEIATFIEKMTDAMLFTKITVNDELNAYKVFETLNSRGVQLSTPDLLKNYLFSIITQKDDVASNVIDQLDEDWSGIVEQLGKEDFTNFLRTDWNSKYTHTTKNELFRKIRDKFKNKSDAWQYFNSLKKNAPIYAVLKNPEEEFWREEHDGAYKEVKNYLATLSTFNIKQPYNVLLVAFDKFSPAEFCKLCKYIECLSFRYNIIGNQSPQVQENIYNKIAKEIYSGGYTRASQ